MKPQPLLQDIHKGWKNILEQQFYKPGLLCLPWHLFFARKGKDPEIDGSLIWHTWAFLGMQVCSSDEDKRGFFRHLDNFGPAKRYEFNEAKLWLRQLHTTPVPKSFCCSWPKMAADFPLYKSDPEKRRNISVRERQCRQKAGSVGWPGCWCPLFNVQADLAVLSHSTWQITECWAVSVVKS